MGTVATNRTKCTLFYIWVTYHNWLLIMLCVVYVYTLCQGLTVITYRVPLEAIKSPQNPPPIKKAMLLVF